jgi:hypothetical protein
MEREDERLSTRDIASGTQDPEVERDTALADPAESPPADTAADTGERTEREDDRFARRDDADDRAADEPAAGAVAASETPSGRGPSPEAIADSGATTGDERADTRAETGAASSPTPAAASAASTGTADDVADTRADDDREAERNTTDDGEPAPLLEGADEFQTRWEEIQVRFVDEPRGAVEDADALVATVMQRLAEGFASEREQLEAQWGRGEDISTEDLRVALQRYRSFFQRLLAT